MSDDSDNDEIVILNQVENVQTIIGTLVDNIYHDTSYQEYLKELEDSDAKSSNKKVVNIKQTFADLKVFNTNREPLFLANDIGIIIGASNVKTMIKNYSDVEKVTGYITDSKGRISKKQLLTKHGVYRILLTNRSKLSDVFRGFIYKLIDHMIDNELNTLQKIIKEFSDENPVLVSEAIQELDVNTRHYQELYELEKKERIEVETALSFNEMYIEQLKIEKANIFSKIDSKHEDLKLDETHQALELLKKKFFSKFSISLVSPTILDKVFSEKSQYDIENEAYILDAYKDNFAFTTMSYDLNKRINIEELFYLVLTLKPAKSKSTEVEEPKSEDYIEVASDYVADKKIFVNLIEVLKTECDFYQIPRKKSATSFIFKTTIEHIKMINRNLILTISA